MDVGQCAPSIRDEKDSRWNRRELAGFASGFEYAAPEVSQRQFAREHDIPRCTLQFWIDRKRRLDLNSPLAVFFVSPPGVAFLHRLLVALHPVFD